MEWLPATSTVVEPARPDIVCWAGGGIILSSAVTRYQLGLVRQAGWVTCPPRASTPQGTCESAMNAARSAGRSPANDAGNLSRSKTLGDAEAAHQLYESLCPYRDTPPAGMENLS